jgi:intracellular sulfur oxidation DsrE/DsrF family protein
MSADLRQSWSARRSFLFRLTAAAAALGGGGSAAGAQTPVPAPVPSDHRFEPARHPQDDWFDQLPGKHRFFFDSTTPKGAEDAMTFAGNYFAGNKSGYGLDSGDLAVIIGLRHRSTPFAFTDGMWAKYSAGIAERIKFSDPKTDKPPAVNLYARSVESLLDRGVHFAVCDMATHALAGVIAKTIGGKADEVYKDLQVNTVANCHFVPAGIVGVNRAQERGYSIAHTG